MCGGNISLSVKNAQVTVPFRLAASAQVAAEGIPHCGRVGAVCTEWSCALESGAREAPPCHTNQDVVTP